ncbi:methyltransferase, TIGR04325 family [Polynucleobacter paneuropaeus]|nr:methyltransferase, TIGR04325 family [Polynucleobacter paneuropaeus]
MGRLNKWGGGRLEVLDFGGALGSCYFQHKNFLEKLKVFRWGVIEQAHFVKKGRENVEDERLKFYRTIPEYLADGQPNAVLLSGVLQYLDEPEQILDLLSDLNAEVLIVDRTPFAANKEAIFIQTVHPSIYNAQYPMRVLSWDRFKDQLSHTWDMVAEFPSFDGSFDVDSIQFQFKGAIFVNKNSSTQNLINKVNNFAE